MSENFIFSSYFLKDPWNQSDLWERHSGQGMCSLKLMNLGIFYQLNQKKMILIFIKLIGNEFEVVRKAAEDQFVRHTHQQFPVPVGPATCWVTDARTIPYGEIFVVVKSRSIISYLITL